MRLLIEAAHIPHLFPAGAVDGLCPGDIKPVEQRHGIGPSLFPDHIPDALRAVGIPASARLDGHIGHPPQHIRRTDPGPQLFQGGAEFVQRFSLDKGLSCSACSEPYREG